MTRSLIIFVPGISRIRDGLNIGDVREAVDDEYRHSIQNASGSYTIIGATEGDQPVIVTSVIRKRDHRWVLLKAHKATVEERQERERAIGGQHD